MIDLIHQIFISEEAVEIEDLPASVLNNAKSFKRQHPHAQYRFWNLSDIRLFIKDNYEEGILSAFDTLSAFALKADLARYCILYKLGGLYSDLSNYVTHPLAIGENIELACFRDRQPMHGSPWMLQNSIIYARKGCPELGMMIDFVVDHVQSRFYGNSSLEPTGPALFGRCVTLSGRWDSYSIGVAVNIEASSVANRSHYVQPDGTLFAIRLQGGGGRPDQLGLKGTNVYGELWDRRGIYNENKLYFPHDFEGIKAKVAKVP